MSAVEPPPTQFGDALDGLLRNYFRSQMPSSWPAAPSVVPPPTLRPAFGASLARSRWTLAASIALLLFGSWLLPNRFTPPATSENGPSGPMISERPGAIRKPQGKRKKVENKNHPGFRVEEDDLLPNMEESDLPLLK